MSKTLAERLKIYVELLECYRKDEIVDDEYPNSVRNNFWRDWMCGESDYGMCYYLDGNIDDYYELCELMPNSASLPGWWFPMGDRMSRVNLLERAVRLTTYNIMLKMIDNIPDEELCAGLCRHLDYVDPDDFRTPFIHHFTELWEQRPKKHYKEKNLYWWSPKNKKRRVKALKDAIKLTKVNAQKSY